VRAAWSGLLDSVIGTARLRVADLGCGTGSLSVLLGHAGHRVVGVDFAAGMLALATAKAADAGVDVTWVEGDAAAGRLV
jgi:ubiquinone/menaquinone biosynthesis C-methylase UbiE